MKKRLGLLLALVIFSVAVTPYVNANANSMADEVTLADVIPGHATAYCLQGITYSGQEVRDGICAGSDLYFGKTVILYQRLPNGDIGEVIGYYECLDKGSGRGIKNGKVIDVWCSDMDACQEFMNRVYEDGCQGKVYIQVFDAEG